MNLRVKALEPYLVQFIPQSQCIYEARCAVDTSRAFESYIFTYHSSNKEEDKGWKTERERRPRLVNYGLLRGQGVHGCAF